MKIKIDDKDLNKLMKRLGFICNAVTKHTLVFTDPIRQLRVRTSKTTSDKARRLKNLKSELRRLNYAI